MADWRNLWLVIMIKPLLVYCKGSKQILKHNGIKSYVNSHFNYHACFDFITLAQLKQFLCNLFLSRAARAIFFQAKPPQWQPHQRRAATAAATFYSAKYRQGLGLVGLASRGSPGERPESVLLWFLVFGSYSAWETSSSVFILKIYLRVWKFECCFLKVLTPLS